jgi:succinate dehydrogenase hydrophobic anchor subunit
MGYPVVRVRGEGKMSTRTIPQRGLNFEYLMWIFTRFSGLALLLLGAIGMVGALYLGAREQTDLGTLMRWSYFQNPNHVVNSEIPDITLGWANAYWQIMQILAILFGVTHGMNGLRVIVEDYLGPSFWQAFWRFAVFLVWLFLIIVGIYVVLAS